MRVPMVVGVIIVSLLVSLCYSAPCNFRDGCPYVTFNQNNHSKINAPNTVYLGNLYNNAVDSNSLARLAINNINNDPNLLPNVKIEFLHLNFTTAAEGTFGALTLSQAGVNAIIANTDDDFHLNIHTICATYNIPHIAVRATDDAYKLKRTYPMLTRMFPTSSSGTEAMAYFIKSLNYSGALLITTKESHVSASAITMTEHLHDLNITNVHTVQVPNYASSSDVIASVVRCQQLIADNQIRPIVLLTTVASGLAVLGALGTANVYGPDLIYVFSYDMSRALLGNLAPVSAWPIVHGSFLFIPRDGTGPRRDAMVAQFNAQNRTVYPGKTPPSSQLFIYDAPYIYAHALDSLLKSGRAFNTITTQDINQAIYTISFPGVSSQIKMDENRDYVAVNGYTIFNLLNTSAFNYTVVATYNPVYGNISQSGNYYFYGLSPVAPNPGYCKLCFNGNCSAQSVCVCNPGWTGEFCSSFITPEKKANLTIVYVIVPIAILLVVGSLFVVFYFKRRREQLVKDIARRQQSDITRSELKLLDRIGRGASGTVYKAIFRGTEVAAKSILTGTSSSAAVEEFKIETAIMCALRHPSIVLFMGSCFDTSTKEMILVMEYCSRGSLHDLINDSRTNLQYELLLHLACQAAQGMNFLHESSPPIIHRDLKSHNILLDDKFNAKISDFGLTRFKDTTNKVTAGKHESLGTVFWSAPEVLQGNLHTEKSDCYSFGIVLWEMFHRSDPYPNLDLITVAMDVMNKGIRPVMNPSTPTEIQDLIRQCWQQDPEKRPSFQLIMNELRTLSMNHPMYSFATGHQSRVDAPSGSVYLVHTKIVGLYPLFDAAPRPANKAYALHNHMVRSNLELYGGYEARMKKEGFFLAFSSCSSAINWCISTQVALLHLKWPEEIFNYPYANRVVTDNEKVIWNGLRVRMSIHVGTPNQTVEARTDRITYHGPVVDEANAILKNIKKGSIVVSDAVMQELINNQSKFKLVEQFVSFPCDGASFSEILPVSLSKRNQQTEEMNNNSNNPSFILNLDDNEETNGYNMEPLAINNSLLVNPKWLVSFNKIIIKESLGKGQVGDYSRAVFDEKEVVVKLLVNQKLREEDLLSLISDCAILNKLRHPNLVPVRGVCLKPGNISIIMDYMNGGNLNDLLLNTNINITQSQLIIIARQIATGMDFLTTYEDKALHIHDNFKSNNILLTKDWQARITDYGQTNIKDLARTMTSISSVAWTAPEILNGDAMTPLCSVYSFGIILWEMFSRKVPYQGEHPLKVVSKILSGFRPFIPPDTPVAMKSLIQSCWHSQPDQRPSWHIVLTELMHMQV